MWVLRCLFEDFKTIISVFFVVAGMFKLEYPVISCWMRRTSLCCQRTARVHPIVKFTCNMSLLCFWCPRGLSWLYLIFILKHLRSVVIVPEKQSFCFVDFFSSSFFSLFIFNFAHFCSFFFCLLWGYFAPLLCLFVLFWGLLLLFYNLGVKTFITGLKYFPSF